jgi:hypothetical protein
MDISGSGLNGQSCSAILIGLLTVAVVFLTYV